MKLFLSTVWKAHYYASYAVVAASCGSVLALTCIIFLLSPFINEKDESWWKQWWVRAAITFAVATPYCIAVERGNDYLTNRNLLEENPELEALTEKVLAVDDAMMKQCKNCLNYHGQTYNGNQLICAMHPYGKSNCSDYQANLHTVFAITNKTTPILERISLDLDPATKVLSTINSKEPRHPQSLQIYRWLQGVEHLEKAISYFESLNDRNP